VLLKQTYRTVSTKSLFSRRSSKSLHEDSAAAEARQALPKTVHHLAWAFDYGGQPYLMIFELTQW
jgi:hypothetical protein